MSEKKLIDANALCRYLSDWQLSCAGNVTNGQDARDSLVIYDTLNKVMEAIDNAPAEEQRAYNIRVDKDKLDAMQRALTQQVHLIATETRLMKKEQWHDAKSDPPQFEKDRRWAGPFLVTDGFCKPFEAYYHDERFRDVSLKLWERPTMRGEGIWPIRPDHVKYWMEWPTPPKEEQHETD